MINRSNERNSVGIHTTQINLKTRRGYSFHAKSTFSRLRFVDFEQPMVLCRPDRVRIMAP